MEFSKVTDIHIAEGRVARILDRGKVIWTRRYTLEIEPTSIWVFPDLSVDNRVICDTDWKLD